MKLIPKHTSGSPIKALKLSRKDVRNLNKATSVEGYGDKVITDEYGNFIPASEIYKYGIVNSSGNMEGFIPEILVSPKYSITKEDLKPKLYSGNIANHPDAKYMSNAYLDAQIQKAKNTEEADKKAGEVNPLTMLNLASAGMSNYMSPTQLGRLGYDVVTGKGKDYLKGKFFEGNNGIVSDNFAKEHPLWSMAINGIGDAVLLFNPIKGIKQTTAYKEIPLMVKNLSFPKRFSRLTMQPFKSELNWDYRDWLGKRIGGKYDIQDIKSFQSHIPEYLNIERNTKANNTWLKMSDGSTWQYDPRIWVQLQSKTGRNLSKDIWWHGERPTTAKIIYGVNVDNYGESIGKAKIWGSSNPSVARSYTSNDNLVMPLTLKKGSTPNFTLDAEKNYFNELQGGNIKTDDIVARYLPNNGYITINNVIDPGPKWGDLYYKVTKFPLKKVDSNLDFDSAMSEQFLGDDIIIGSDNSRKFLIGNNGDFNFKNPNVYKIIIPTALAGVSPTISKTK